VLAGVIGAERHIDDEKGAMHGTADGAGVMQHLIHGDRQRAVIAEHHLGERIADEDEVHASFIGEARSGVIIAVRETMGSRLRFFSARVCTVTR